MIREIREENEFLPSATSLSSEKQNMRDAIVSETNYSKIQSVISCTGLELASSCKWKKGSSASSPLKELSISVIRHQLSHTDAIVGTVSLYCTLSLACSLSLSPWRSLSSESELLLLLYNQSSLSQSNRPLFNQPINSTDSTAAPQGLYQEWYKQ